MNYKIFTFLFLLVNSPNVFAQEQYEENIHYKVVSQHSSKVPVVKEFFSYWCAHCYRVESLFVKDLKRQLPENVKLEKIHVDFMPFTNQENQKNMTNLMLYGRMKAKEDEITSAIFESIHEKRNRLDSLQDAQHLLAELGITIEMFEKATNSIDFNDLSEKNKQQVQKYRAHFNSVPTFIVNDKYKVLFSRGMTMEDMTKLILWLVELD
ncbi:DsbA family protein [Planctobacterium marinum]|uniref:DsbA family protein n=1 Tax=Planctobacterium marinum TaxID=1631968 RepID=UPI001E2E4033|nr:DsbA family protein [Planctobacterium marinum]MCC2606943.1 DsbA family protein [Planctobacterium marinum]